MPKLMRSTRPSKTLGESTAVQKLFESPGAVAHGVFLVRLHFAEGKALAIRDEDRIIAEALAAARRKHQPSMHLAFKNLAFAMRHGERKRADEFGGEIAGVFFAQFLFHTRHGDGKVFGRSRP